MAHCISLAKLAGKATKSNPMVGSVLVHNHRIIGEGFHEAFGQAHGERNAINSVLPKDRNLIKKATLYITLEPCSRHSKTPPCVNYILENQISKVVIGALDPNPLEKGRSIKLLKSQGIELTSGILESECNALIRPFQANLRKRPYIILKWAQSKDGYMSRKGERTKLTNVYSDTLVHRWRSEVDAIMIGTNTAQIDNPKLTTRHWPGDSPKRIVIDKQAKLSKSLQIFNNDAPTLILTEQTLPELSETTKYIRLEDWGPSNIARALFEEDIFTLLIEGGRKLLNSFIESNLWDEARIFNTSKLLKTGLRSPNIQGKVRTKSTFSLDNLVVMENLT